MSLLLEALKRAALEKQARGEGSDPASDAAVSSAESSLEPWIEPGHDSVDDQPVAAESTLPSGAIQPAAEETVEETADEAAEETIEEEELVWDEPVAADDVWNETAEVEIGIESGIQPGADDFFAEIHETLAATTSSDPEPEPESEDPVGFSEGMHDREESDTATDAIEPTEQRDLGTRFTMADDELQPASAVQAEHAEAGWEEPEPRSAPGTDHARNREALEHLLGKGRTIARRTRRRENFLYAMLLVTAIGGILSYYLYLLNNNRAGQADKIVSSELVQGSLLDLTALEETAHEEVDASQYIDVAAMELDDVLYEESVVEESGSVVSPAVPALETAKSPAVAKPVPIAKNVGQAPAKVVPPGTVAPAVVSGTLVTEQPAPAAVRIAIRREPPRTEVADALGAGYLAYQSGDFGVAEREYAHALAQAPGNRDALLGAAAVAFAQGKSFDAMAYYQRRLADDPEDRLARIGLLSIAQAESNNPRFRNQLNGLLREDPRSGPLHFLKGVSLASTGQWNAAQSAFYSAYQIENRNADYAYNLAISLDHLNQRTEARRYYETALALAATSVSSFSVGDISIRLAEMDSPQ